MISLFLVIGVINSSEYRSLYGSDPLAENPNQNPPMNRSKDIQNVKVYPSPDFDVDIKSLKKRKPVTEKRVRFQPTSITMGGSDSTLPQANQYHLSRNNYRNEQSYGYY